MFFFERVYTVYWNNSVKSSCFVLMDRILSILKSLMILLNCLFAMDLLSTSCSPSDTTILEPPLISGDPLDEPKTHHCIYSSSCHALHIIDYQNIECRARFYKLVASVYGTFVSQVSRCQGFYYRRGGRYTP